MHLFAIDLVDSRVVIEQVADEFDMYLGFEFDTDLRTGGSDLAADAIEAFPAPHLVDGRTVSLQQTIQ